MQFYTLPFELWEICMFFTQSIIFLLMPMTFLQEEGYTFCMKMSNLAPMKMCKSSGRY